MFDSDKVVLTGIKPTGMPHIGNYVGALKPMIELSQTHKTYMFIADLHSLNTIHDANTIRENTYAMAATMVAGGLNLNNAVLFRQSDIVPVYQLATLLMNVTPKGLMNRAHSYKAAVDRNAAAGLDTDAGVNMGLYTYPILMAADILLYGADIVPVGADQKQHVEFARDIAGYFNNAYGDVFRLPEPVIGRDNGLIPGLDGRKMSKSYDNTIAIFAPENELKRKIMRIITDSKTPDEPKNPDESTIFQLYKHFATDSEIAEFREMFLRGGMGYGTAKTRLFDRVNSVLGTPRSEYERLMQNRAELDAILADGAARARVVADKTIARVKRAMLGLN
ncbi:MAG: tryptophan--tRNA ligase [Alphaproteobacteria bacterium]|nr:tryptophan--tRNA ligase [Alphaproteobacteria bacterium]